MLPRGMKVVIGFGHTHAHRAHLRLFFFFRPDTSHLTFRILKIACARFREIRARWHLHIVIFAINRCRRKPRKTFRKRLPHRSLCENIFNVTYRPLTYLPSRLFRPAPTKTLSRCRDGRASHTCPRNRTRFASEMVRFASADWLSEGDPASHCTKSRRVLIPLHAHASLKSEQFDRIDSIESSLIKTVKEHEGDYEILNA